MNPRRRLIAGNWKMNKGPAEAGALARAVVAGLPAADPAGEVETVVCPPVISLSAVAHALAGSPVFLGAQNAHHEPQGAFTGEVSVPMLTSVCVTHVILGHSERRQFAGEDDAAVNRKLHAVLAGGLTAIVCVGETLAEREAGRTLEVVGRQVEHGLAKMTAARAKALVVAYEPVWAIGTGRNATPAQAQEVHAFIRSQLAGLVGPEAAATIRILYGGSMKPANAPELLAQADIDGGLIGGASLEAASFLDLVAAASKAATSSRA